MIKCKSTAVLFMAFLLILSIAGCSKNPLHHHKKSTPSAPAPAVVSTTPSNAATGVALNSKPTATFNKVMDPATITAATFTVKGPGVTPVTGAVTYLGTVATFTPTVNLASATLFTATITTGAKDPAGTALASNFVWTFTTVAGPDTTAPTVSATVPSNAAVGVALNSKPTATFSEPMNPTTLTAVTFTVKGPGVTPVAGTVTYIGTTATFTPASNFAASTVFTATITTGAKDVAGNALAANYVWTFTTGAAPDTTAPTVSSTIPANTATNVALNTKPTATFSEAMDPVTITTVTYTLKGPGVTPVAGTVTYVGTTATFSPTSALAPSTLFTATITTGAKDLAGNALAVNYVWTFTSGAAPDTTAPTVSSTVPVNAATGVALNAKPTATFSEAMDPLTITSVTFTLKGPGVTPVSGAVTYVGTTATFSPLSALAASTLFTATITTGAKDAAGNAIASNFVWTFTTGAAPDVTAPVVSSTIPANTATGVALNQAISATFSEAMDPATITAITYTLKGPGVTPVTGAVTYVGTTATFTPLSALAASTLFTATVTTGAKDLAGNAMASNYVWTFTTGAAPDTTAPTVSSTIPANAATGAALNTKPTATFSEAMDPLSITTATFMLKGPGVTPVAGAVTYVGTTATFSPTAVLAASTLYTGTITTGAKDLAGNALAADFVWTFTTGAAPDTTPPTVSSTVPANSAVNVALNTKPTATFSEAMDPLTITSVTYTLKGPGVTPVSGAVTYVGTTATFSPLSSLAASTLFTATITTGAKDLAGNAIASNFVWTFTTGAAPDVTAPTVSSTIPANTATLVALNTKPTANFSEAMDPLTITTATYTLVDQASVAVAGTVSYVGTTATFTPLSALAASTLFTATITTGAKDLAGNALASAYVWSFTTGAAPDTTPPTVSSTIPSNGAITVALNTKPTATFSEPMDPLTITSVTYTLKGPGVTPVAGAVTYVGTTATFSPSTALAASTLFTATITTGAKDLAGNAIATNFVWTFTTGAAPDVIAPTVSATVPANTATNVALNTKPTATFSEAMDPSTITTVTFTLTGPGVTPITGAVTYVGTTATFSPLSTLAASTLFTATITTGAKDLAGNALATNKVWSFTTGAAPDVTPPTVAFVIPADLTTGEAVTVKPTATFDEPMDPLTLTTATFTLMNGTTPVTGTVSYSGNTATFTPSVKLLGNTLYDAKITTGATDLAGNALQSDFDWSFTTGPAPVVLLPVVLGQASHFAVLAGFAVTTVPASAITGDVGVSPAAESFITGFSQTAATGFSTSPQVTGFIFAADMAEPTPTMLTQAKGDLTTAYNDAAARTPVPSGPFLNPGAGNLAGLNLVPGLYKFTGTASATTDFTLTGDANDVWILQVGTNLDISNGVHMTLAGGALAKNVFWKVGTEATLGTTVIMYGTIMADASITMNTGATLNGRALAFTGTIALDQNIITVPAP